MHSYKHVYFLHGQNLTTTTSSPSMSTPHGPIFLLRVCPFRWSQREFKGMFHDLKAPHIEHILTSIAFITSSNVFNCPCALWSCNWFSINFFSYSYFFRCRKYILLISYWLIQHSVSTFAKHNQLHDFYTLLGPSLKGFDTHTLAQLEVHL